MFFECTYILCTEPTNHRELELRERKDWFLHLASSAFLAGMPLQREPIPGVPLRPDHNTGNTVPYSLRIVCGFFNVPLLFYNKGCETGPPACSPYPRRLESLTICWCNYKGSIFCSVIFKTLSVGPAGVELTTSRMTIRCSINWAIDTRPSALSTISTLSPLFPNHAFWKLPFFARASFLATKAAIIFCCQLRGIMCSTGCAAQYEGITLMVF